MYAKFQWHITVHIYGKVSKSLSTVCICIEFGFGCLCVLVGLILLFYLAFYIFLAALFALTMYVMLQTLDDHRPTYQDRLSTPGNTHRLHPKYKLIITTTP